MFSYILEALSRGPSRYNAAPFMAEIQREIRWGVYGKWPDNLTRYGAFDTKAEAEKFADELDEKWAEALSND